MRRAGLIAALLLVVLTNALVLAGAVWNRAAAPQASLRLTERELPVYTGFYRSQEDIGLALQLRLADGSRSPDWLHAAKLAELGFQLPQRRAGGRDSDRQPLPRRAWLVLEFDGPAWEAAVAAREQKLVDLDTQIASGEATLQQRQYRQQQLQQMREGGSRLVAVDAGRDAAALRQRFPDAERYLITAAEVRAWIDWPDGAEPETEPVRLHGRFSDLLPAHIHVPVKHRSALLAALGGAAAHALQSEPASDRPPRYAVLLSYGARHEPWIAAIESLSARP